MANVQGKEQVSRNPYSIEYRTVRTVPVFTVIEVKVIYVLLLAGGFVMIVAQQFLDPNGSVLDPYSFDMDPDPAFWAEYRSGSNPDPGF